MFTRLTGRQPTMEILAPFAVSSISRGRAYPSSVLDGSTRGSFTVSPASTRKRTNRRSLSADNLWTPNRLRPLDEAINVTMCQQSPEPPSDNSSEGTLPITQSDKRQQLHEIQEADYEFYNSSLEFLNTHHSRINTGDRWVNRNKRKPYVPLRRQSESSLMSKVLEVTRETTGSMIDPLTADPKEDSFTPFDQPSCWRDFDQSCSSDADMDTDCRTLLSPVDIMLVSSISSPTRYYDCPKYRKLVKTYLSSTEQEFDEMIEFGFPYSGIVDDKDGMDYKAKDYRFLTLRMTLTPWHARANEVNLYGHEDSEKQIPVQEKVNKFLSRTSAMLSCSSQRVSSYVQDIRSSNSKGPNLTRVVYLRQGFWSVY
ncbi:hypothetical protein BGX31_001121 [Mortierella sp. GBA43]|nr:hypothetical protein BGX31_001121 [Mortierella sp. GBA43]